VIELNDRFLDVMNTGLWFVEVCKHFNIWKFFIFSGAKQSGLFIRKYE
jgi:hypothetical protein